MIYKHTSKEDMLDSLKTQLSDFLQQESPTPAKCQAVTKWILENFDNSQVDRLYSLQSVQILMKLLT